MEILLSLLGLCGSIGMILFLERSVQPVHIINIAVNMFDDMRYYNVVSSILNRIATLMFR